MRFSCIKKIKSFLKAAVNVIKSIVVKKTFVLTDRGLCVGNVKLRLTGVVDRIERLGNSGQ